MTRPLAFKRRLVDVFIRRMVGIGGAAVIATIALIFFYLLWVVAPIMKTPAIIPLGSVEMTPFASEATPERSVDANDIRALEIHGRPESIFAFTRDNRLHRLEPGDLLVEAPQILGELPIDIARRVYQADHAEPAYALLDTAGDLRFLRLSARAELERQASGAAASGISLFGSEPVRLGEIRDFDAFWQQDRLFVVSLTGDGLIELVEFDAGDLDIPLEEIGRWVVAPEVAQEVENTFEMLRLGPRAQIVYALDGEARMHVFQAIRGGGMRHVGAWPLVADGAEVSALAPLSGRYSWLVADNQGMVGQWTLGREGLLAVRQIAFDAPILHLVTEQRRKVAMAVDAVGNLHLMHTTSGQVLTSLTPSNGGDNTGDRAGDNPGENAGDDPKETLALAVSPRGALAAQLTGDGQLRRFLLDNEHPEISWSTLWEKVWYEGYSEPSFTWQSSASESDSEPKFSLVPLLLGTFKAALYAMLIAVPIAVLGAIYTAYFMAPAMRRLIKPGVEIMAAMPTVVLGFLAGLWLAPIVEANLTATLLSFVALPLAVLLSSRLAALLPEQRSRAIEPWLGVLCVPLIVLIVWLLFTYDPVLESFLFAGDAKHWFRTWLGLDYDQRNALIVGIAMGIAVIPIVFTIAEDAIFGVPRHLTSGSLALGATPWQTLSKLVLPFASPGIFSAVMIGFGRAIGETMIVLMATGNTPLLNMNLFEGMRTFAANIAVELPESEVGSSHFRLLFLTALVLFVITFAFNTIAEVVRARLRKRYASL